MTRQPLPLLLAILATLTLYRVAVILHLGIDPYVDEAYYWGWAQHLDWGYYSKPPLIAGLIAASTGLLGDSLVALKLPSLVLYPLTALVLHALGSRLAQPRAGFWAALAFITLPLVSALGLFVSTDAPLLFCWAAGMLMLLRALEAGRWRDWLLVGGLAGLGLMSKYTMAAFIGSAFLALLLQPAGRRALTTPKPWAAVLLALAILTPNLWWNWQHDFPTFRHTAEITRLEHRAWNPGELGEFLAAQWLSMGPLLGLGFMAALVGLRRNGREPGIGFLLAFTLPLLVLVSFQALTGRANGNWAAPIFLGATLLTVLWAAWGQRWRLLMVAVGINAAGMVGIYHWPDLAQALGRPLTAKTDPFKRTRGWSALARAVEPHLRAHPEAILLATDRDILAQLDFALHLPALASWNPAGRVLDHYDLTTRLEPGRTYLFVHRDAPGPEITRCFASATPLGTVEVAVHENYRRSARITLLEGFSGYRQPGSP
ncbi:MAG: glycosyltransferase family 39 protein [Rhodocyclaceae bacterium]|jgi:4-amino-4-deoxy-L-arabinose transferase-like glycosyltransferase|nr:glycosyltransferase family 39 protein [Rhodocyclaceae bacterium]